MACFKTLTLSGACVLETCETKAAQFFLADAELYQEDRSIAYSQEHCYCLFAYYDAAFTTTYLGKYDSATNTIIQKADLGAFYDLWPVYDATAKKFIMRADTDILTFDPVTETTATFAHGATGFVGRLVYISQKGKVYGQMGVDGGGLPYIGYIDLDLQIIVQLGTCPSSIQRNLAYSTVSDSLYCASVAYLSKFDLATNTGSNIIIGLNAAWAFWDNERNLMIFTFGQYTEFDTATDTATFAVAAGPDFSMRSCTMKDTSTNIIWGRGRDSSTGDDTRICGIDLDSYAWVSAFNDYIYGSPVQFSDGSCIAPCTNIAQTQSGVRKLCLP